MTTPGTTPGGGGTPPPADRPHTPGFDIRGTRLQAAGLPVGPPSSTEFSLGLPASSCAEVDELLRRAEAAGATLPAPAHMRPFGVYSGYFADPDGHLFEIAWNSNEPSA